VGPSPHTPVAPPSAGTRARTELGLLLRVAHRRAARTADEALHPLGIEGRHLGVLVTLARRGPLSQTQLVEALAGDKSGMVRTVDDLERLHAAVRRQDPADRRARRVELTDSGRELLTRARSLAGGAADELFGCLTDEEQQTLHRLLTRIAQV
jgi:MarR family transcriptional regulator, lower aerobic nicotinate degradation pathway regulator